MIKLAQIISFCLDAFTKLDNISWPVHCSVNDISKYTFFLPEVDVMPKRSLSSISKKPIFSDFREA